MVSVDAPVTVRCTMATSSRATSKLTRTQLRSAVTFMASSTISWSCSEWAAMFRTPTTSSWATS